MESKQTPFIEGSYCQNSEIALPFLRQMHFKNLLESDRKTSSELGLLLDFNCIVLGHNTGSTCACK